MGARVYDPDTGTFLQTDPDPGADPNAYGYTAGDPVNETDLSGDVSIKTGAGRIICTGLACLGLSRGEKDVAAEQPSGRASSGQVVGRGGGYNAGKSAPAPPPNNDTSTQPGAKIKWTPEPTWAVGNSGGGSGVPSWLQPHINPVIVAGAGAVIVGATWLNNATGGALGDVVGFL
jgi:hypothetical protein